MPEQPSTLSKVENVGSSVYAVSLGKAEASVVMMSYTREGSTYWSEHQDSSRIVRGRAVQRRHSHHSSSEEDYDVDSLSSKHPASLAGQSWVLSRPTILLCVQLYIHVQVLDYFHPT